MAGKDSPPIDISQVEKIVESMKKKQQAQSVGFGETPGALKQLKAETPSAPPARFDISQLSTAGPQTSLDKLAMALYTPLKDLFNPLIGILSGFSMVKELETMLDSANMRVGKKQYLITATVIPFITAILLTIVSLAIFMAQELPLVLSILVFFFVFFFGFVVAVMVPGTNARRRGLEINKELPFALRHMATELRSGIGLYRVMQSISSSDYGVLSEEFAKTIAEIEEGVDTKEALKHLSQRTTSKGLKKALAHIIRALRTGGNLSQIMNEIAKEVAFEIQQDIREFAEKMNFFGVIFIFIAIVGPVFIAIIAAIRAAPIGGTGGSGSFFSGLPVTPHVMAAAYLVVLPMVFLAIIYYIRISQPKI